MAQHKANTNDRKRSGSVACKFDGRRNEVWKFKASKEQCHAECDGNDIWVRDDAEQKFWCDFAFEQIDAVGKECDVENDNKTAVRDDTFYAEGTRDNWIAEEGSVIEDESELRFKAEFAFVQRFIKNDARRNNE